jgi:hypothetical protein
MIVIWEAKREAGNGLGTEGKGIMQRYIRMCAILLFLLQINFIPHIDLLVVRQHKTHTLQVAVVGKKSLCIGLHFYS